MKSLKTNKKGEEEDDYEYMLWSAKGFYGLSAAAGAFFSPYVSILLADRGASGGVLGAVSAIRPWLGILSSTIGPMLADRWNCHRSMLVVSVCLSAALRVLMWYGNNVVQVSVLLLMSEVAAGPSVPFVDSMVVANCAQAGADYGRQRLWGSAAFGGMSPLAGLTVEHAGIGTSLFVHLLMVLPSLYLATRLRYPTGYQAAAKGSSTHASSNADQQGWGIGAAADAVVATATSAEQAAAAVHHRARAPASADQGLPRTSRGEAGGDDDDAHPLHAHTEQLPLLSPRHGMVHHNGSSSPLPPSSPQTAGVHGGVASHSGGGGAAGVWSPTGRNTPDPTTSATAPASPDQSVEVECTVCVDEEAQLLLGGGPRALPDESSSFQDKLKALLCSPAVWTLLLKAFALGFGSGMVATYLFLYARDQGASPVLSGLLLTFDCIAEVLVFWYQRVLLNWLGSIHAMHLCILALVLRLMLYATVALLALPPWFILPIELLNGLTFAGGWAAASVDCLVLAPPGLAATLQVMMSV